MRFGGWGILPSCSASCTDPASNKPVLFCHACQTVFCVPGIISMTSWEKEGMTCAYVVILGLDGCNWHPDILRTWSCISPSLCSIWSQESSGWILHLLFWASCVAGAGSEALPARLHILKEPPCPRGLCVPGWGGSQLKESLGKLPGPSGSKSGAFCPPMAELCFLGSQAGFHSTSPDHGVGHCPGTHAAMRISARRGVYPPRLRAGMGRDPDSAPGQALAWGLFRAAWSLSWYLFREAWFEGFFFLNQNGAKERATWKHFPKTKSHCRKWRAERRWPWRGKPGHWGTADSGLSDASWQSWLWACFWREILRSLKGDRVAMKSFCLFYLHCILKYNYISTSWKCPSYGALLSARLCSASAVLDRDFPPLHVERPQQGFLGTSSVSCL